MLKTRIAQLLELIVKQNETLIHSFDNQFSQIESLLSLHSVLKPEKPMPATRGWAASPDFLLKVTEFIIEKKPKLILEASSGVSTLVAAQALSKNGSGRIISLEHDSKYLDITRKMIELHGLQDIVSLVYAPIKEIDVNGRKWLWYDINNLKIDEGIDLLVIDGPPGSTQKLARYPAVPLFYNKLNKEACILLDDGKRNDEKTTARLWANEFPSLRVEFFQFEKGAFFLEKK